MIKVINKTISVQELKKEAQQVFGDMVKCVVDLDQKIMAISGELHSNEEAVLLKQGSKQANLWGINLYPDLFGEADWLEFNSMINIRPSAGNKTRGVENPEIRKKIIEIVGRLVTEA